MAKTTTPSQQPVGGGRWQEAAFDMNAVMSFIKRFVADTSAAAVCTMCALGNRLGLFRDLREHGPASSVELAARTGLSERYLREWLLSLASAGYLELDKESGRFSLPSAHAAALAHEDAPFYMGDMARLIPALSMVLDEVVDGFRTGSGVSPETYPTELYETMWRKDASKLSKVLVQQWVPAVGGLREALESGGSGAQIGCGDGRALILLAQAFPESALTGYDALEVNIAQAQYEATAAGVADRVSFQRADPAEELGRGHALVMALDAVHDAVDPAALLRRVRDSLDPTGVFLLLETNGEDNALDNAGPVTSLLYGISTLYSVPQGLAAGADPVGMMGLPPRVLLPMCKEAGFSYVQPLLEPSPFNTLYELRP